MLLQIYEVKSLEEFQKKINSNIHIVASVYRYKNEL